MRYFPLIALMLASACVASPAKLLVHEWGTFTSLQDDQGNTIGGINTDDEPLPPFVHDLLRGRAYPAASKGIPGGLRNEITMRLETPVMYFHLPPDVKSMTIDVDVQFHGGLLSQFYPDATTNVPDAKFIPSINEKTLGTLKWNNVRVGVHPDGPKTDSHVWLAPRAVDAADVTASNAESERYLFYRGVGHIDAPLKIRRAGDDIGVFENSPTVSAERGPMWLAEFRQDGACAFRRISTVNPAGAIEWIGTRGTFAPEEFSSDATNLRGQMLKALISQGLFDDEAQAMLNTWEKSYFKSPGLRLFYVVPRQWTDQHLPLKLSAPAEVTRVMIGRLELISTQERSALRELSAIPNISTQMTRAWDLYKSLGRFRQALILDEHRRRSTSALTQFVNLYNL